MPEEKKRPPDIFTEFPANSMEHLAIRYHSEDNGDVSFAFAEAADRLAASYRGQPIDDTLLLPYLLLYRHAIELALKHAIQYAAGLRRRGGDPDAKLRPKAVAERLKYKHGHRLLALLNELSEHSKALDVEPFPKDIAKIIQRISQADPVGESFRYASPEQRAEDDRVNFKALSDAVRYAYRTTTASVDVLSQVEDVVSEYEADMRSEMRGYMEADLGDLLE